MKNASNPSNSTQNLKLITQDCVEVSAGLVFRDGKLLITQRRPKDHLGGLWEFPGGKRECQETDEACLRRELHEELGIKVAVKELIETLQHDYPGKSVRLKFFRCALLKNEPVALGCEAVAWVNAAQLENYAFPEADQRLLGKLRASPELWK